jgi:hypothetical protein
VSQQRTELMNQLTVIKNEITKPLNYDEIAPEVGKRLTHSATVQLLDGTIRPQTKPLNEPLELVQRRRGIK